ncbi:MULTISPECIES: hypothetical protein [unclassified Acidovorax]|uniref:hypothetical protein n=1 Tax=unclassified Acidovorax TaxID=2684926 RepID=UPI00288319AF|nr:MULTISPECIES: hypothetical protein [unclassified Acidovorax]
MPLIDQHLPTHDFAERHTLRVRARPGALLDCAADPAIGDDPFIERCIALREAPARLLARLGRPTALPARVFGLADFTPLGRDGDRELAFGLAGRFWQADYGLVPWHAPASADAPGFARLVMNVTATPLPDGATLLATETRVHCPDALSRRRFAPYWWLIRPVGGLIRRRLLQRIAKAASTAAVAPAT